MLKALYSILRTVNQTECLPIGQGLVGSACFGRGTEYVRSTRTNSTHSSDVFASFSLHPGILWSAPYSVSISVAHAACHGGPGMACGAWPAWMLRDILRTYSMWNCHYPGSQGRVQPAAEPFETLIPDALRLSTKQGGISRRLSAHNTPIHQWQILGGAKPPGIPTDDAVPAPHLPVCMFFWSRRNGFHKLCLYFVYLPLYLFSSKVPNVQQCPQMSVS